MQEDPQIAEQQRRMNLPPGFDPRKAVDPAVVEKMVHAQSIMRAQAQAATTIYLATIVGLASSAFGLIAALAWNNAFTYILENNLKQPLEKLGITQAWYLVLYAFIVTLIGVIVIVFLNRIGRRLAKKSVIESGG